MPPEAKAVEMALQSIGRGSAAPALVAVPSSGQQKFFPRWVDVARRTDEHFAAGARGDRVHASRPILREMGKFGRRLSLKDEHAVFLNNEWTEGSRRHVLEQARAGATMSDRPIVASVVTFSDAARGTVTLQPLVGPQFRVPYGGHRSDLHAALAIAGATGKPFVRVSVFGEYFGDMLEHAKGVVAVDLVGGPEFAKRWNYLSTLSEISPATRREARSLIANTLSAGATSRPYMYADESDIVLEWTSKTHGVITVRVGTSTELSTLTTRIEAISPTAESIARLVAEP